MTTFIMDFQKSCQPHGNGTPEYGHQDAPDAEKAGNGRDRSLQNRNQHHFPLKSGGRRSRKDIMASLKSSDMSRMAFFWTASAMPS